MTGKQTNNSARGGNRFCGRAREREIEVEEGGEAARRSGAGLSLATMGVGRDAVLLLALMRNDFSIVFGSLGLSRSLDNLFLTFAPE